MSVSIHRERHGNNGRKDNEKFSNRKRSKPCEISKRRAENGAYPEKLEQLVPQYLEKIPLSPTTDYPIFYRKDSDDFVLDIKRIEL